MRFQLQLVGFAMLLLTAVPDREGGQVSTAASQNTVACAVTKPNGIAAVGGGDANSYGNSQVSVFGLWPDGTVVFKPGGAGFLTRDGSLGMKFGWQRGVPG